MLYIDNLYTGYPESMLFTEFRRRFEILVPAEKRASEPVMDERKVSWGIQSACNMFKPKITACTFLLSESAIEALHVYWLQTKK